MPDQVCLTRTAKVVKNQVEKLVELVQ